MYNRNKPPADNLAHETYKGWFIHNKTFMHTKVRLAVVSIKDILTYLLMSRGRRDSGIGRVLGDIN